MKRVEKIAWQENIFLLPILLAVTFVPLIVYLTVVPVDASVQEFWKSGASNSDFFSATKAIWIMILGLFALLATIASPKVRLADWQKLRKDPVILPLVVYTLFVILSSLLSAYKSVALWGFPDRQEGMFVLLAYAIFFLATYLLVKKEKQIQLVLAAIGFSTIVAGLIGVFQFFGLDFFRSNFGKLMILPKAYHNVAENLNFTFGAKTIYSTMYNTNNVGSFMSMVFVVAFALFLLTENKKAKWGLGIFTLLAFFNTIGCNSRAGYVGAFTGFILVCILSWKRIRENWKAVIVMGLCLVVIFVGLDLSSGGSILKRISASGIQGTSAEAVETAKVAESSEINDMSRDGYIIRTEKNSFLLQKEGSANQLKSVLVGDKVSFYDEQDKEVALEIQEGQYVVSDARFPKIIINSSGAMLTFTMPDAAEPVYILLTSNGMVFANADGKPLSELVTAPMGPGFTDFNIDKEKLFLVSGGKTVIVTGADGQLNFLDENENPVGVAIAANGGYMPNKPELQNFSILVGENFFQAVSGGNTLNFSLTAEGWQFLSNTGQPVELRDDIPVFGPLKGRELLGSGRGYIFGRSIPMLKDTALVGYGPDTYAIYFPQDDYRGKLQGLANTYIIVDKPHNMYLQIGINVGVVALLAFLAMFVVYFVVSLKNFLRLGLKHKWVRYNIAFGGGITAYLVAGLFNDSIVSVAPVFWVIFGLGCAMNKLVKAETA